MSEEIEQTPEVEAPAVAENTEPTDQQHMIPKSRFDEVNNRLKELMTAQEQAAKERQEQERKALEERQEYKALYEQAVAAQTEAEQRAVQLARDNLRQRIANEAGYPKLWARLQGDTEEELKADLETMLAALPKPSAPTLNGGAGSGERKPGSNVPSTAQIKEMAARLGVSAKLMAQQYGVTLKDE